MEVNYCGVVKQQLWDYYRRLNDYAASLAREVVLVNILTGETSVELVAPSGLKDELAFTREEIKFWQEHERRWGA